MTFRRLASTTEIRSAPPSVTNTRLPWNASALGFVPMPAFDADVDVLDDLKRLVSMTATRSLLVTVT